MFCPKCATENVEGASYCRSCGANISLVPQALTGELSESEPSNYDYYGRRRRRQPSSEYAIRSLLTGIVFAVMAVMISKFNPGSSRWWFWLLFPAMMLFAKGFAELARLNHRKNKQPDSAQPMVNAVRTPELRSPQTGELMTPVPSVTEGTTRHLGADAQTRPFEFAEPRKPS